MTVRPSCLAVLIQVIEHIDELGEAEVLDRLDVLHEAQRRAESEVLLLAVQFAILHDEHTLDPMSRGLDGREKAIHYGGAGTPLVTEFCAADFGARLQLSPWAAQRLIADALDLKHRLPQLWRRVQALEVKVSYARYVARKTRDLQREEAGYAPRPGSATPSDPTPGSPSSRSSTSRDKRRSMPTRSPTDIGRPCI